MNNKEWEDMKEVWMVDDPQAPSVSEVLQFVRARSDRFDKRIKWRNLREWAACLFILAVVGYRLPHADDTADLILGFSLAFYAIVVAAGLWFTGRSTSRPDPALSRNAYRDALEEKFAKQIRLAKNLKYWYILPLPVFTAIHRGVKIVEAQEVGDSIGRHILTFVVVCAFCIFVWWRNESRGVRLLQKEWDQIRRALDEGALPASEGASK